MLRKNNPDEIGLVEECNMLFGGMDSYEAAWKEYHSTKDKTKKAELRKKIEIINDEIVIPYNNAIKEFHNTKDTAKKAEIINKIEKINNLDKIGIHWQPEDSIQSPSDNITRHILSHPPVYGPGSSVETTPSASNDSIIQHILNKSPVYKPEPIKPITPLPKVDPLAQKCKEIETNYESLLNRFNKFKAEHAEDHADLQQNITSLEEIAEKETKTAESLQKQLDKQKTDYEGRVQKQDTKIKTLENKLNNLEQQYTAPITSLPEEPAVVHPSKPSFLSRFKSYFRNNSKKVKKSAVALAMILFLALGGVFLNKKYSTTKTVDQPHQEYIIPNKETPPIHSPMESSTASWLKRK